MTNTFDPGDHIKVVVRKGGVVVVHNLKMGAVRNPRFPGKFARQFYLPGNECNAVGIALMFRGQVYTSTPNPTPGIQGSISGRSIGTAGDFNVEVAECFRKGFGF